MTEAEIEARVRQAEQVLSAVRQRTDDHELDIKQLGPLVVGHELLRAAIETVRTDLHGAHENLRDLKTMLEREREERREGQAQREREIAKAIAERKEAMEDLAESRRLEDRKMRYALLGVFLTALASIVVPLLQGAPTP